MSTTRRSILGGIAAGIALDALPRRASAQSSARVVVIGGGFAGASCARALSRLGLRTTLVEQSVSYVSCPFSNAVIGGLRDIHAQTFTYEAIRKDGIELLAARAQGVDAQAKTVTLEDGTTLAYDRLVVAPGVDLRFDAIPGYDEPAAETIPHAWKAGAQTALLRAQLVAMKDGGTFVMSVPANPYRCPPGPYERVSLIANYFKAAKPNAKIVILDAKDAFSKQKLFEAGWAELYPGMIDWISLSNGGAVKSVDPRAMSLTTDFETYKADAANVIPPQKAGMIARLAGVADRTGWCPVHPETFESTLVSGIHVIGDAAIMGAIPKSAFAANGQGKACATAIAALLAGQQPPPIKLINTCYSLIAPDYGISIAGVYTPGVPSFVEIEGSGGTSPLGAPAFVRSLEANYARNWFTTITRDVFG